MTAPSYVDDDDAWMDPNLTEPKLQDDLNHRLSLNRRVRQRPRAAYGFKSAPNQQQQQQQQAEMTQIRYFKYVPYNGMSEPEKRRYLSLGPARLTSSRTAPPQPAAQTATESTAAASFWPSASRTKSLKVYDYHLAELSMTYRSQPSLLNCPRRQISTPSMSPRHQPQYQHQATFSAPRRPLFFQLHSSRGVPASAPSATQQELQASHRHTADVAEKTTQVSRGGTPFIDSALSDYPTEPRDVVSKSDSNRLLNVVSVDECHVRHRRRRRRLRRVHPSQNSSVAEVDGDAWEADEAAEEAYEEGEFDEEEEEEDVGGWRDSEATADAVEAAGREAEVRETVPEVTDAQDFRQEVVSQQLEQQESAGHSTTPVIAGVEPAAAPSVITTRPTTERSGAGGRKKRRTEKEMRKIAATKFLRRNEILREKMAIYLDWKLNQERMGLIELRLGDPAARFERFTVDLVQHEAMVASQYRDGDNGAGRGFGDGAEVSNGDARGTGQESPQLDLQGDPVNLGSSKQTASVTAGPPQQRQELSLTEMYEALSA